ncbi:MAG: hypothetical protein IT317_02730 [Anaerolineales bacterium]|nr:hypothetical protein [Anaerolineales bacterium]
MAAVAGCADADACASATATLTAPPPKDTATLAPTYTAAPATATPTPTRGPARTLVDVANLPRGEWVRLAGMANARAEKAVAVLAGLIYLPAGAVRGATFINPVSDFAVFDPAANRWTALPNLRIKLHHAMAVGYAGRVYVFGDLSDCEDCGSAQQDHVYDPAAEAWSAIAQIPDGRIAAAPVWLGDYIYLVGGQPADPFDTDFASLLRYDPAADAWTAPAPMPTMREHLSAVAYDGKPYALEGRWDSIRITI